MKLLNLSVGRLATSNLASTENDALQIKYFIEAILFFCEGKTNGTRICDMAIVVIVLPKWSGQTVLVAQPLQCGLTVLFWFDCLRKKYCVRDLIITYSQCYYCYHFCFHPSLRKETHYYYSLFKKPIYQKKQFA